MATGNIVIQVVTAPGGSLQPFTLRPSWGVTFLLTDQQSYDSGPLQPGAYSIAEDAIPGWSVSSQTSTGELITGMNLGSGQTILVTFTNTATGSWFQLEKLVVCAKKDATIPVRGMS